MNTALIDYSQVAPKLNTDTDLTPMETVIVSGYSVGMSGKEIAEKNFISPATVIRHTQNIYDKLDIKRNIGALVSWFLEKYFRLDMAEIKRRAGAICLLCIIGVQIVTTDFNSTFIRSTRATTTRTISRNKENA